jgi:hypothetical protein
MAQSGFAACERKYLEQARAAESKGISLPQFCRARVTPSRTPQAICWSI